MRQSLGVMEERFAQLLWDWVPIASGQLVERCAAEFGWKKSTMYTMLRRLCERGLFVNENGTVCAGISREDYLAQRSEAAVEDGFGGSLPLFVAAFTRRKKLSAQEVEALRALIDRHETEG